MIAREAIDRAVRSGYQTGEPSSIVTARVISELDDAGFEIVELPEQNADGDYALAHIDSDEICIDVRWIDSPDAARRTAAALLRAAAQLEELHAH